MRALWELVTPELRSVSVWTDGDIIKGRFEYAVMPDDEIKEDVALAATYVVADFSEVTDIHFEAEYVPVDKARLLCAGWSWVYLRKE